MTRFFTLIRKSVASLERNQLILLIIWLLVMLSLPVLFTLLGSQGLLQGLTLAVLLQVALVLNILYRAWGWWGMLRGAIEIILLAWIMLAIVVRSGLPYGEINYTAVLQPQVLGVPVLIPLTWLMMLPPAWAVAKQITYRLSGCLMRFVFVVLSAAAYTAWEFYFNPLMAHLGIVEWVPTGTFYGVPLPHFFGLFLVSAVITFAFSPKRLPGGSLVLLYGINWAADFILLVLFWRLPVPALVGFGLMGGMLLWAALSTR